MRTRDQEYAQKIYDQVTTIASKANENDKKKYGTMALKLPVIVRTAGLVQSIAFVQARNEEGSYQRKLLEHIAEITGHGSADALFQAAQRAEMTEYMLLTQQVMDVLRWYKRFAQSVLKVELTDEGEDN
jgi:CRISPR-associated protein Cmr5